MPTTIKKSPAAERMVPTMSKPGFGPCTPGSTIDRLWMMTMPTTRACTTKAARQLIAVVMIPPTSGPAAAPMPPAALIAPKARAREVRSG
ncbi:MAG: hypothetical protein BWX88_05364 [Planctomycetes bacterium ADurb.Bin126]|nr:MAG: hypothetical protein BWX88_05364 [Planctomycetes bacterium ADurb.Bin126]